MTLSTLTTLGTKPISKAEYLHLVEYSRHFTAEDIFFTEAGSTYPNLDEATVNLIDNGETAWGVPEFEQCLYDVFRRWTEDGLLLRVQVYAQWLIPTALGESRTWLEDFARGDYWEHMSVYSLKKSALGAPDNYLYPFNFRRLIEAQAHRDRRRAWLDLTGAQNADRRFGLISE
ncbi:MAG: hypothetical protein WBD58_17810 [Geitlerinemataceae cyanobacterium]